jgi:hypothetical protein
MPSMTPHEGGGAFPGGVNGMVPPGPLGMQYLFGDGSYSGNIIQGGSVLQPQASYVVYDADIAPTATLSYVGTIAGSYPMSNLVDASNTSAGSMNSTDAATRFIFTYATAKRIRRVTTSCYIGSTPTGARLAYSDNGTDWTPITDITTGNTNTYLDTDIPDVGAHRWWSLSWLSGYLQYTTVRLHEGVTLQNCIVITGAATVAPDAETGSAWFSAMNVVIDGASASLAPSTNCKGLVGIVRGGVYIRDGGKAHIDKLGKAGAFGNLTILDLVPAAYRRKLKNSLSAYIVSGAGATGGAAITLANSPINGNVGSAATDGTMRTGGGGSGGARNVNGKSGAGGTGQTCCGGGGGGAGNGPTAPNAGTDAVGGAGGVGAPVSGSVYCGGGAGDPVGTGSGNPGQGAGGGLLMLLTPVLSVASGCIVSADGAQGGAGTGSYPASGGSGGGGCIVILTPSGGYSNAGTVRASGGAQVATGAYGGAGGNGSVNTLAVS